MEKVCEPDLVVLNRCSTESHDSNTGNAGHKISSAQLYSLTPFCSHVTSHTLPVRRLTNQNLDSEPRFRSMKKCEFDC